MTFATPFVLSFVLLSSLLCASARASDYEVGASLACDTRAQVERFVALFTGDAQAAIQVVNAEEQNPAACVIRNVAYMRGTKVGIVRHGESAFEIVRILVVGIETARGVLPVRPSVHFALFGVKEYAV
jgi:hypothetical protein